MFVGIIVGDKTIVEGNFVGLFDGTIVKELGKAISFVGSWVGVKDGIFVGTDVGKIEENCVGIADGM